MVMEENWNFEHELSIVYTEIEISCTFEIYIILQTNVTLIESKLKFKKIKC